DPRRRRSGSFVAVDLYPPRRARNDPPRATDPRCEPTWSSSRSGRKVSHSGKGRSREASGGTESLWTLRWREADSNLYGAFPVKWSFLGFCRFFVRSWKAVLRPVACDQVRGARGRGQGTETV